MAEETSPVSRSFARRALLLGVLATAAGGCGPSLETELERLFEVRGPGRFVEGRPAVLEDDWYVQAPVSGGKLAEDNGLALAEIRSNLRRLEDAEPEEELLAARGLVLLAEGDFDKAVLFFQAAISRSPESAKYHNDLAIAYVLRAESTDRPFDLVLALGEADRALELSSLDPTVRFNRALVLSKLSLHRQARAAWRQYLELDDDPRWQTEAEQRLAVLEAPNLEARWPLARDALDPATAPSAEAVSRLVADYPFKARQWGEEELLGRWAGAEGATEAEAVLAVARAIGDALSHQRDEYLLRDAVRAIDDARMAGDEERQDSLRRGHRALAAALGPYADQDTTTAEVAFTEARDALAAAGSPLGHWAEFYLTLCASYAGRSDATERFERLRQLPDLDRYPALRGRVDWLLGTMEIYVPRPQTALDRYRLSYDALTASSGRFGAAFVHVLFAEAYARIGEVDEGWRHRRVALADTAAWGDPRRRHSALMECAQALVRQGRPELSAAFVDELIANAKAWGNSTALTEAFLQRARLLNELGHADLAATVLERSRKALDNLAPGKLRDHLELSVRLEEGRTLAVTSPMDALPELTAVLDGQDAVGYNFHYIRLLTARAQAYLVTGDREAAAADLERSIASYEALRANVVDEALRIRSFAQAQPAFEAYLALVGTGEDRDPARAFGVAERARARFLLDLGINGGGAEESTWAVARQLEAMPPDVALVEYAVLPERLLVWVARGGRRLEMVDVAVPAMRLAALAQRLRTDVERQMTAAEVTTPAKALFGALLEPVHGLLEGVRHLVIVPDRFLQRVPFAVLVDPLTDRFLIEDRSLAVAPSATLFTLAFGKHVPSKGPPNVLAVGEPEIDTHRFAMLGPLPNAEQEAVEVANLYAAGSLLLTGPEALEESFLDAAPAFDVIHFAGHAQTNPDALRLSRLLFTPSPESDGLLYAYEIYGHRLERTRLVVLSACRTLDVSRDDREGFFGLASVFLASGVPSVVASLWDVDDRYTRALMVAFHRRIAAGESATAALRLAAIELLESGDPDLTKPWVWSAFEVVGGLPAARVATGVQ